MSRRVPAIGAVQHILSADELIRQATLECAERGLMLLRVRDEIRMTICAYQTLFQSSMAYGMRKVLLAEQGKNECNSAVLSSVLPAVFVKW